jgi:hypothetical protein
LATGNGKQVHVPPGLHLQSRFCAAFAPMLKRLGDLETSVLGDELESITVRSPVYVTSLARAGTTIVTEMLERHPALTSHRYSDFPNVWTPYWRNHLLQKTRRETPALAERAHHDRIQVSNDSPEAVEEVLWMHFFPGWHQRSSSQVLGPDQRNRHFDAYYRDHIRKLLAVRGAERYLAKGNYNIARLAYLHDLFPDARFLVPLRDPQAHIASLAKQHRLFLEASQQDPRVGLQLALAGHFEFGPRRRCVHFGDQAAVDAINACWRDGREVEGWARYWAATYRHLYAQLAASEPLAKAVRLFRYEDLCNHSEALIAQLLDHCGLSAGPFAATADEYAGKLSLPDYYAANFSAAEQQLIEDICMPVLAQLQGFCRPAV